MPSVASVDPFWSVTLRSLRELTRLAVAALVLAVGLGGATAAPTPSATGPFAATVVTSAQAAQPLPRREPVIEQTTDTAAPAAIHRADAPTGAPAVADARPEGHAREPGRGVPARRGPPGV
ncbi:hypothetical protein ACGFIG_08730 [Micromonospora sp. NPDC049048]|uniref:hypothetical protein n=1 Tax=Micromonospora sp. NPDC049048 TaxID=3364263 RepID=UPI003717A3E8